MLKMQQRAPGKRRHLKANGSVKPMSAICAAISFSGFSIRSLYDEAGQYAHPHFQGEKGAQMDSVLPVVTLLISSGAGVRTRPRASSPTAHR